MMNRLHPANLIKKVLPREALDIKQRPVAVGDTFIQAGDSLSLWVVENINQVRVSKFPLVRLSRVGHPHITKTVSMTALTDNQDYKAALQ